MARETLFTPRAPAPVGPYSQAVRVGDWIYVSGQVALDAESGELVEGGIEAHTRKILRNIETILEAAGASLDDVVKTSIYLTDLGDFGQVNQTYGEFFAEEPPARTCVQVAALPKGAPVEMEAVAYLG